MDVLVDEIFQKHSSNQEEMTFDEWSQWFLSLEGMKEVLEMRPHGGGKSGQGNISKQLTHSHSGRTGANTS